MTTNAPSVELATGRLTDAFITLAEAKCLMDDEHNREKTDRIMRDVSKLIHEMSERERAQK